MNEENSVRFHFTKEEPKPQEIREEAELFAALQSAPPRLTAARQRAEKAEAAYEAAEKADERFDGFGHIPKEIMAELRNARRELAAAEAAEYHSRSGQ